MQLFDNSNYYNYFLLQIVITYRYRKGKFMVLEKPIKL